MLSQCRPESVLCKKRLSLLLSLYPHSGCRLDSQCRCDREELEEEEEELEKKKKKKKKKITTDIIIIIVVGSPRLVKSNINDGGQWQWTVRTTL